MTARPPLVRSIPFWGLAAASLASIAVGAWVLADKLGVMSTTLADGTATGVEVYVGQSLAVVGAILLGAGVVGVLLTLTVAAAASLRPTAPVEVIDPLAWDTEDDVEIDEVVVVTDAPVETAPAAAEPESTTQR